MNISQNLAGASTVMPNIGETIAAPAGGWKPDTFAGKSRSDLSRQWIARPHDQRFVNLSDLEAFTTARYRASSEDRIDNRALEIIANDDPQNADDIHDLMIGLPNGRAVAPTHWAFGQLCGLASAPAGHYRELPSQIVRDALSYRLRFSRGIEQVKTYASDDEVMAITGPDYGRIPDFEVVKAVRNIAGNGVGDSRWKVPGVLDWSTGIYNPRVPTTKDNTTLFASDRDVFIFLVDDLNPVVVGKTRDGGDDLMFRGFYVKNSEVGSTTMKLAAFYLRAICCNRIMWGVEGFEEISIRHSKYAPDRFIEEIRPALTSFAEHSQTKLVDAVAKAKAAKLVDSNEGAIEFLKARKFNGKQVASILEAVEREEGRPARTAWDFAQGITAVARNVAYQDERVTIELQARTILEKVAA